MNSFGNIADVFFSGNAEERSKAGLEYLIADGPHLAPGISGCEVSLLIGGTGRFVFKRRGDTGESHDCPPGVWRGACDPSQLERIWDKLREIGPESFPLRIADPGDPITYISAYAHGLLHTMAIGPRDPARSAPGLGLMAALAPILAQAEAGECVWSVKMDFNTVHPMESGCPLEIRLRNDGLEPIGVLLAPADEAPDFEFRYAQNREDLPYPEWHRIRGHARILGKGNLVRLEPGVPVTLSLDFEYHFPEKGSYLGLIGYSQFRVLDTLVGQSILTGNCFSPISEFRI